MRKTACAASRSLPTQPFREDVTSAALAASERACFAVAVVVLLAISASAVYAAVCARGLFQDGVYYLYRIAEREWFYLADPARTLVQVARQAPVVLLRRWTDLSIYRLGQALSLAMLLLPALLCSLCWPILPRGRKGFILFPILFLLVGASATSFNAVGEATIAASYWWCLFFLLLFRSREPLPQVLFLLLCAGAFYLHEGAFPLMLVLLIVAVVRLRLAPTTAERAFLLVTCLMVLLVLARELWWVIDPRDLQDRARVLEALANLTFIVHDSHLNLPLITGTVACIVLAAIIASQWTFSIVRANALARVLATCFVVFAVAMSIIAVSVESSFSPNAQVLSRYHPVFVSFALGLVAATFAMMDIPDRMWLRHEILVVIVALGCAQIVADVSATLRWRDYVDDLKTRLSAASGLIPWDSTLRTGDAKRDADWRLMSMEWVIPLMSIVYAKDGVVSAMIDPSSEMTFRPVDPRKPDQLPKLRGIDFTPYKSAFSPSTVRH
jgi:hypothetical protein